MSLNFIRTAQGNFSVVVKGRPFQVASDHPNYEVLKKAIVDGDEQAFLRSVDIPKAIARQSNGLVEVVDGEVVFQGQPIHHIVAERILQFVADGLPTTALAKFLENLMENPSKRSVEQLYTFLENKHLPITEDGCFLAYKAVKNNFKDKHSGTIDNHPGTVVKVARNSVDDDFRNECSYGLHVGGIEYVRQFGTASGDRFLIVKVNPKHAVAVPTDYNCQKLRVEEYLVVSEVSRDFVLGNPLYASDGNDYTGPTNEYEVEDDWDDDYEYVEEVYDDYDDEPVYSEAELEEEAEASYNRGYEAAKRELAAAAYSGKPKAGNVWKRDANGRFTS